MTLADVIAKSAVRLGTLVPATLTKVYPKPPSAAPPDDMMPAVFQRPSSGDVTYSVSQRDVRHSIEVVCLVSRTEDQPADYDRAMALLEAILGVYEASTTLGVSTYYDAKITTYEIGPGSYGDAQYLSLILTLTVKEKFAVTMN